MKRTLKLNQRELKHMIAESVKTILRENQFNEDQIHNWYFGAAEEMGYEDFVISMWTSYFSKNIDAAEQMLNTLNDSINEPFPDGYRKFGQ